jgi:hypothetical protein
MSTFTIAAERYYQVTQIVPRRKVLSWQAIWTLPTSSNKVLLLAEEEKTTSTVTIASSPVVDQMVTTTSSRRDREKALRKRSKSPSRRKRTYTKLHSTTIFNVQPFFKTHGTKCLHCVPQVMIRLRCRL